MVFITHRGRKPYGICCRNEINIARSEEKRLQRERHARIMLLWRGLAVRHARKPAE